MRIYVAGPMRGYPLFNYQAFEDAVVSLRKQGHDVVSPHEFDLRLGYVEVEGYAEAPLDRDGSVAPTIVQRRVFTKVELTDQFSMEKALAYDLSVITHCDAIALLPGWEDSEGAAKEKQVAEWCAIDILYLHQNEDGVTWRIDQAPLPTASVVVVD